MTTQDLSREIILDHYQSPRNHGRLDNPTVANRGHNPLCGDEIELSVDIDAEEERIRDIAFTGRGCSISQASASMMTEAVKGKDKAAIGTLFEKVHNLLTQQDAPAGAELGKLAALSGVREFPSRVKCASLCWHTLNAALDRSASTVSTE